MAVHRVRLQLLHRSGCGSLMERHHADPGARDPSIGVVAFSRTVLAGAQDIAAVVISRSGQTSEAVRAAQLLEREKNIRVLAVTGTPHQPLEQTATATLPLLPCDEQSTVMTRSFSSMLLGLQYLAACYADNRALLKALAKLPAALRGSWLICIPAFVNLSECGSLPTTFVLGRALLWVGLRDCA